MHILFISAFFSESGEQSYMCSDLVDALSQRGHYVAVATTANEQIDDLYTLDEKRNIAICRISGGKTGKGGLPRRAIADITFNKKLTKAVKEAFPKERFDLIYYDAPPVTVSKPLLKLKRYYGARLYVFVREIFPQTACDIGLLSEKSMAYRYLLKKQKELLTAADTLGVASKGAKRFLSVAYRFLDRGKIEIFPFTKSLKTKEKTARPSPREKFGIPDEAVVFFFAGAAGKQQDAKFICDALERLSGLKDTYFVFSGHGSKAEYISERLHSCKNVILADKMSRAETERFAAESNVGVVTLDYRFRAPYWQETAVTYMENRLPVLAATDPATDFRNLLKDNHCGLWCASNDIFTFCNLIKALAQDEQLREELGKNALIYAQERLDVSVSVRLLEEKAPEKQ